MERRKENVPFNEVQRYVQDCSYPCSKEELISCAQEHHAPSEVIRTLDLVAPKTEFSSLNDVRTSVEQTF